MTTEGTLSTELRLAWLREQLQGAGKVSLRGSATVLGVSEMTVRRDLADLEKLGDARRVRGGAVAVRSAQFSERRKSHSRAKSAIASKISRLLPTHGAVALDGSSTVLALVAHLREASGLIVVTNGPDTFAGLQSLAHRNGLLPVLTGGELDEHGTGSLVGPLAMRNAREIHSSRFFCSALGATVVGTTEHCLDEAHIKRAIQESSAETILGLDSSKLGAHGVARGFDWSQIAVLATELPPEHPDLAAYRDLVEVI